MEPLLSNVSTKASQGEARDLLLRLYREIGISAVVAALEVSDGALKNQPSAEQRRNKLNSRAA